MPYTLDHILRRDYLEVTMDVMVNQEKAMEEALSRWKKVLELSVQNKMNRVLAIMKFNETIDLHSKFQLTTSADSLGMKRSCRLAVVVREEKFYRDLLFAQTALHRLGYQMQLFRNRRRALKWLAEK